jgi:hypothetical protein
MPDFSGLVDKHFKVSNVPAPMELTVKEVKGEGVGPDKELKPVAYFIEDQRGLVLNAGRYNALAAAAGTRDTDTWTDIKVTLSVDPDVKYKGKVTGGLVLSNVVVPQ